MSRRPLMLGAYALALAFALASACTDSTDPAGGGAQTKQAVANGVSTCPAGVDDADQDGVCDDLDRCSDTTLPENIELGTNRWADIDADGIFETVVPHSGSTKRSYTLQETRGCSCQQIVAILGLGEGHLRHGCSSGVLDDWISSLPTDGGAGGASSGQGGTAGSAEGGFAGEVQGGATSTGGSGSAGEAQGGTTATAGSAGADAGGAAGSGSTCLSCWEFAFGSPGVVAPHFPPSSERWKLCPDSAQIFSNMWTCVCTTACFSACGWNYCVGQPATFACMSCLGNYLTLSMSCGASIESCRQDR